MQDQKVYVVKKDGSGRGYNSTVIGYAMGNSEDITAYYEDQRQGGRISLSEVTVIWVTPELVQERKELIEEQGKLEIRLEEISELLKPKL